MLWYVLRRLGGIAPMLLIIGAFAFALLEFVPGDAAVVLAGENATLAQITEIRRSLGLDRPVHERFVEWFGRTIRGDLGTSIYSSLTVRSAIMQRIGVTISLAVGACVLGGILGVLVGAGSAATKVPLVRSLLRSVSSIGIAVPHFWLGMVFIYFFALDLGWFPVGGYAPISAGVMSWLSHILLPSLALGLAVVSEVARQTRAGFESELQKDYVRTARSKGASSGRIMRRHVLRNVLVPVVTVVGMQFNRVFGGAVVVERVFNLPGLGSLAVDSVLERDLVMIQGIVLLAALTVLLVNLLVDLLYGVIDPRIRIAGKQ